MSDIRDYDLAETLPIDSPQRMRAIAHPLRSLIVDLVLERAMTVSEISEIAGRPRGSVAHHVDVLVDAGLVQVVRTRRVRAIDERFYGRTARTFEFDDHAGPPDALPFLPEALAEIDRGHDGDAGFFTYRHARIPVDRAKEFADRLAALTLEFTELPHSGRQEFGLYVGLFPTNRLGTGAAPQDPS